MQPTSGYKTQNLVCRNSAIPHRLLSTIFYRPQHVLCTIQSPKPSKGFCENHLNLATQGYISHCLLAIYGWNTPKTLKLALQYRLAVSQALGKCPSWWWSFLNCLTISIVFEDRHKTQIAVEALKCRTVSDKGKTN